MLNLHAATKAIALVMTPFFLPSMGCATAPPFDLEVASIDRVSRTELGEIIGADSELPLVAYWVSNDDFLRLKISTNEDLAAFIRRTRSTLHVSAGFCDAPDDVVLLGMPGVYVNGTDVAMIHLYDFPTANNPEANDDKYTYDIVLFTEWDKARELPPALRKSENQRFYSQYNLAANPSDICISIGGGNMMKSYRSSEIRIPRARILEAISRSADRT